MFPRLRQKLGTVLVDRIDVLVEFSTLGEYALADDLLPVAVHDDRDMVGNVRGRPVAGLERRRSRDDCPFSDRPFSSRFAD